MRACVALVALSLIGSGQGLNAQETRDFGLPPPSGFQNPVLPPPSGSQNPVLPPPTGQRYLPGIGGRFGDGGVKPVVPSPTPGVDPGLTGSVSPVTRALEGGVVSTLADIAPALRACWHPPSAAEAERDVAASVRFSLRRDGTLFGQPRITWEGRGGDPAFRERFAQSVVAAVRSCTPMRLSAGLGASIAGRPFVIRFHGYAPSNERSI